MFAPLHERIATGAFENYERRIRPGPLDDWLQAEREILGSHYTGHVVSTDTTLRLSDTHTVTYVTDHLQ